MRILLSIVCLLAAFGLPAHAGLMGSQLQWDYYAYGGLYETGNTWTVPGSGGNFCIACGVTYFTITADDTSITFDYSVATAPGVWSASGLSLAPTIYNGIAINLISGSPFTSVTIDPSTNMAGFDASRLSFTGSQIQIDWQNLPFDNTTIVKLDIGTTPEPSSWVLLGCGLVMLGATRQRARGRM